MLFKSSHKDHKQSPGVLDLWFQFIPLSVSDVTMAFGDPAISTTLAHLPDSHVNLAAVGIGKSIAVFFESPVIMILHASNALSASKKSRAALWRFTLLSLLVITGVFALLLLPWVFFVFSGKVLGVSGELAARSRGVLLFLVFWPAAIGWRRFFQGALIHFGHSHVIARAGFGRLALVTLVLGAGYIAKVHGFLLAGAAMIGGVFFEALLVTLAMRGRSAFASGDPGERGMQGVHVKLPTDMKSVWKYYWPLANSMLVVWGGRALLLSIVARSYDALIALAVWPTAWSLVLLISNATRMVQQVIIKNRHHCSMRVLFKFVISVGLVFFFILFGLASTSAGKACVSAFIGGDLALLEGVREVLLICSPIPILVVFQNAIQGFLISEGKTGPINRAAWLGTFVLLGTSALSISSGNSGAATAAASMGLALFSEILLLLFAFKHLIYKREVCPLQTAP